MTNEQLEARLETLVNRERTITREILRLINLAEDRKLHLERGFDSLVRWLCKRFGFSETAALRRVNSARMLKAVPDADGKIQSGALNITTLSEAQVVIKAEEKRTGRKMPIAQMVEVTEAIQNKSQIDTKRTLAELFPETTKVAEETRVKDKGGSGVRISITVSREEYEVILKVREALGHALPEADLSAITAHVYQEFWKRKNPEREVREISQGATGPVAQSKTIPAQTRRIVFRRDKGRCQFVDPATKRRCESTLRIEIDHIQPRALGGTNEPENLRCLCRAHNAFRAERTYGPRREFIFH